MIYLVICSPPSFRDLVFASQFIVALRAWQVIKLCCIAFFAVHRHQHPPSVGFFAVEEHQFIDCARHGYVELTVETFVFEFVVFLSEDESFHKIPYYVSYELGCLVVEVEGGIVFVDAKGRQFVAEANEFGYLADFFAVKPV